MDYNEEKFAELVIYIADKCQSHDKFGATKLNKLLFYADFQAYRTFGKPITGAKYMGLEYGPAPHQMLPVREQLVRNKSIGIFLGPSNQERITPLREANLALFEPREISLVDSLIESLKDHTANSVSEISHCFLGWQAARAEAQANNITSVEIPYETVFVSSRPLDAFETANVMTIASKHGWI